MRAGNHCLTSLAAAAVRAAGYVISPREGLYRPIWEYDAKVLAWDPIESGGSFT